MYRLMLNKQDTRSGALTIERIKSLNLPYCSLEQQAAFGRLERMIAQFKIIETALSREERLQKDLLSNLRDYLSLELFRPEFPKETGIKFMEPYLKTMTEIDEDDKLGARQLTGLLLQPGNLLMDNMKKARIVINRAE